MVKMKYRKYGIVSNQRVYNMLWMGLEVNFTDIPLQKPNISQLAIKLRDVQISIFL